MTERLARACSRHPWRAIGGWIVAVVLAVAALALLLGDLTTEGHPTNNPESQRAGALIANMEFVHFHPTCLDPPDEHHFLI